MHISVTNKDEVFNDKWIKIEYGYDEVYFYTIKEAEIKILKLQQIIEEAKLAERKLNKEKIAKLKSELNKKLKEVDEIKTLLASLESL